MRRNLGSRVRFRISFEISERKTPPSLAWWTGMPCAFRSSARRLESVVLPLPSIPSKSMKSGAGSVDSMKVCASRSETPGSDSKILPFRGPSNSRAGHPSILAEEFRGEGGVIPVRNGGGPGGAFRTGLLVEKEPDAGRELREPLRGVILESSPQPLRMLARALDLEDHAIRLPDGLSEHIGGQGLGVVVEIGNGGVHRELVIERDAEVVLHPLIDDPPVVHDGGRLDRVRGDIFPELAVDIVQRARLVRGADPEEYRPYLFPAEEPHQIRLREREAPLHHGAIDRLLELDEAEGRGEELPSLAGIHGVVVLLHADPQAVLLVAHRLVEEVTVPRVEVDRRDVRERVPGVVLEERKPPGDLLAQEGRGGDA